MTPSQTEAVAAFDAAFNAISTTVEFNREWSNGTGGFDNAVYGENRAVLPVGKIAKAVTPGGRRIILISTLLGNVIVFDRKVKVGSEPSRVLDMNCTSSFLKGRWIGATENLLTHEIETLLGTETDGWQNIGVIIAAVVEAAEKIKLA